MKRRMYLHTAALLCAALLLSLMGSAALADARAESMTFSFSATDDGLSSDERFEGYVCKLFGIDPPEYARITPRTIRPELDEDASYYYDLLAPLIKAIANGDKDATSTQLTVEMNSNGITQSTFHTVFTALLADFPYELYWFDKTAGTAAGTSGNSITLSFSVLPEYAAKDSSGALIPYTVDPTAINSAKTAVEKANTILETYENASDYNKLKGYKEAICGLVKYNYAAIDPESHADYGNPWQLVWVFDGDDKTDVVCEGYSKAFQYLCDRTTFSSDAISVYSVTGDMGVGDGEMGGHMWNLAKMENGKVYLVDVTNCDGEDSSLSIGYPDKLFMAGYASIIDDGYAFACGDEIVNYEYDDDTLALFPAKDLSVSDKAYLDEVPVCEHVPEEIPETPATCLENGHTAGTRCSICGEILSGNEVITALGHDWGQPAYKWAADYSAVTASHTCTRQGCGETESETVSTTSAVTTQATCTAMGMTTYTATFENPSFTVQTKPVQNINALGHDWGEPTYVWAADNSSVTASHTCTRQGCGETETETVDTQEDVVPPYWDSPGKQIAESNRFSNPAFTVQRKDLVEIPALKDMTLFELPAYTKSIGDEAFRKASCQAVWVPDGCTSIGERAFADCPNLLYIDIPLDTVVSGTAFQNSPNVIVHRYNSNAEK